MISKTQFEWILFDLDNTLLSFTKSSYKAFEGLIHELTIDVPASELYPVYYEINHKLWADREGGLIGHEELKLKRWTLFFDMIKYKFPSDKANSIYFELLTHSVDFVDGAEQLLELLFGRYKMMIVTNGLSEVQNPRLESAGMNKYFEFIVISDEIGFPKPQIEFFEKCHEMMAYPEKESILVIGDTLSSDIKGANDFGYKSCWFNHDDINNETSIIPDLEVKKLTELFRFLS